MTVAELIAELQKVPPDALVVMSSDAEGNGFSPLHQLDIADDGEYDVDRLSKTERAALAASGGHSLVVLWPGFVTQFVIQTVFRNTSPNFVTEGYSVTKPLWPR